MPEVTGPAGGRSGCVARGVGAQEDVDGGGDVGLHVEAGQRIAAHHQARVEVAPEQGEELAGSAHGVVDGEFAGTGAGTVSVSRDETHTIMARLGDRVAVRSVGKGFSTTGILDIVGGLFWLVPFVGLAFPGAYSLEEDNVALLLPPATQS